MEMTEQPQSDEILTLIPQPSFVIKTKIEQQSGKRKALTKVFINVCSNPQVPLPPMNNSDDKDEFYPEVVYPLIMNNQWEIPIITSDEREDTDKKGALSYVYDCFINTKCMTWIHMYADLKDILVEWCLESVELRFGISLDRDSIKFPKMTYKGIDKDLVNLQVLKKDLDSRNFQKQRQELERIVKNEEHLLVVDAVKGKSEKLGIDQNDSNDDDNSNVSIFPTERNAINNGKLLIQEISESAQPSAVETRMDASSILEPENTKLLQIKEKKIKKKSEVAKTNNKLIKFDMSFHNLKVKNGDNNKEGFQLLIKLVPDIIEISEFEIMFDSEKQSLLLKCVNKNFRVSATDASSFFEIPVPSYLLTNQKQLRYRSFYVMQDKSLNIFL